MKKILLVILVVLLSFGPAYAADINDWIKGDGTDSIEGTDSISDLDTLTTNYLQDPLDRLLTHYIYGCTLTYATAATITVGVGEVVCQNAGGTIRRFRKNTSTVTIDITADLDTGAEANSTMYHIYAIADADATTFTCEFSASSSAPDGATYYRYLGSVFNNGSGNFEIFDFLGYGNTCTVVYDSPDNFAELANGAETEWTEVDCASSVPFSGIAISFAMIGTAGDSCRLKKNGSSSTNGYRVFYNTSDDTRVTPYIPCDSSQIIEYDTDGASQQIDLNTFGYIFVR